MNSQENSGSSPRPQNQNSNMLLNIALNVLIPSVILTKFSTPERLGPTLAFWVALAFPLCFGIWEFIRSRKANFFSGFGLLSVALTGGLGFLALDVFWFAVKEAAFPFALGLAVLVSTKTKIPLIQTLLLNESVINMGRIKEKLNQTGRQQEFDTLIQRATLLFAVSFFLSAALNFGLARYLLKSPTGTPEFNAELGQMTAMSFPVIALPVLIFTGFVFWYLFSGITRITALSKDEILLNQGK
jgi:hypothetical protein